jgi:hypothetical protein
MKFEAAAAELALRYDWGVVTDRFAEVLANTVINSRAIERLAPQVVPVNS